MSYYTTIRVSFDGDDLPDDDALDAAVLAAARAHLERDGGYAVDDILEELARVLGAEPSEFNRMDSADFTPLFRAVSKALPAVTVSVWGHGEEPRDVWTRQFLAGKLVFKRGPF